MGKTTDKIWAHWKPCGLIHGKQHAICNYCGHKLQTNVTRFKHHIVLCSLAPEQVKNEFRETVAKQSIASEKQKRILSLLELSND